MKQRDLDILQSEFNWMRDSAKALVKALGKDACRFVGGAVRDSLIGKDVSDVDLATTLPPEEVIQRLRAKGIKVVPTGLKHGTVTVVFPDRHFEVTTLRHDTETYGRHADVDFHDDWEADAARRDFTINGLYLDSDGTLYDYFNGEEDLKAGKVHFIGEAAKRIEEDALRILRLFRFHAWYGKGALEKGALSAVQENVKLLDILSEERVAAELLKLLSAPDPTPNFKAMHKAGVLDQLFAGFTFDFDRLEKVVALENTFGRISGVRRMGAFFACDPKLVQRLKLSNRAAKRLAGMTGDLPDALDERAVRLELYNSDKMTFQDHLIYQGGDQKKIKALLDYSEGYDIPTFPVSGKDLEGKGVSPGVDMGRQLKALDARWVESDFKLTKDELLGNSA